MDVIGASGIDRGAPSWSPLTAIRAERGVVAVLLAVAGLAWWLTAVRMAGMDAGPGTELGALGWFLGVWALMMAAMMLPSLAPTAAGYASVARRRFGLVLLFAGGYLFVWSACGVVAYVLFEVGKSAAGNALVWHSGGRWLAAGVLMLAALYQLTPIKRAFLHRCRSPLQYLDATRQDSCLGAFATGLRNGGWCLGCSWAMMAALFALGVMSLTWMAAIAVLVALEKVAPSGPAARIATVAVLATLAFAILVVPHDVPGFVIPSSPGPVHAMRMMG
jgi:predicted metal-binding membrane protein